MRGLTQISDSRSGLSLSIMVIPVALIIILTTMAHGFASLENLSNLSSQIAALVIVAIGQMTVALVMGLDLSVGSVISLVTCMIATGGPLVLTIPFSFAVGIMVGLMNGWGVTTLRIHPIIMTLSSMTFLQGVTLMWQAIPGGHVPDIFSVIAAGHTLGVPHSLIWSAMCAVAFSMLLNCSRFGLHLYAVGGNAVSARLNGVAVKRVTVSAYVLCSMLAVIAGLYLAARIASGDPKIGASFGLDSITAIALGGTQLSGGVGGVASAIVGALSLGLISNGMNLLGISPFLQSSAKGLLLIVAICAQRRKTVGL
jgi:ribose transport system permease protein